MRVIVVCILGLIWAGLAAAEDIVPSAGDKSKTALHLPAGFSMEEEKLTLPNGQVMPDVTGLQECGKWGVLIICPKEVGVYHNARRTYVGLHVPPPPIADYELRLLPFDAAKSKDPKAGNKIAFVAYDQAKKMGFGLYRYQVGQSALERITEGMRFTDFKCELKSWCVVGKIVRIDVDSQDKDLEYYYILPSGGPNLSGKDLLLSHSSYKQEFNELSCFAVAFSPSGEKIAMGGKNGFLKVVDKNLKEIVTFPQTNFGLLSGHITGVGWLNDKILVASTYDGTVSGFVVPDEAGRYKGKRLYQLMNHTGQLIDRDYEWFLAKKKLSAKDPLPKLRSMPTFLDIALVRGEEPWAVTVGEDKAVVKWALGVNRRRESMTFLDDHTFGSDMVKVTADGRYVVCAGGYSKVFIFDAQTMAVVSHFGWRQMVVRHSRLNISIPDPIRALDIRPHTPDGILQVAVGSDRGYGSLFEVDLNSVSKYEPKVPDTDDGVEIRRFQIDPMFEPPVELLPTGERIPIPGDDRAHKHIIQTLQFTPNGRYLITADSTLDKQATISLRSHQKTNDRRDPGDGKQYIRLWEVETGRLAGQVPPEGSPESFMAIDVSPQGDCFVAVTDERKIYKIPLH